MKHEEHLDVQDSYGKKSRSIILNKLLIRSILLSFFFSATAFALQGQEGKISLDLENTPLRQALESIEAQSNYFVMYNAAVVNVERPVSIRVQDMELIGALDQLLEGSDIQYEIVGQQIVLKNREEQDGRTITGKVIDENGEAVIGASVVIRGTTTGVITGIDGQFSIKVPSGPQVLVISFVGMLRVEKEVGDENDLVIIMRSDAEELEEVVVIGYGIQKKVDLTGSVSVVSAQDVNAAPVIGVDQAIQGRVSGVRVTQTTGQPGEPIFVRIRGVGTIGDNDPLYIVDGVPTKDGMNVISPSEIESISILKDAASAAIYGARSANGVVLITTKKGSKGEPRISYSGYVGLQTHGKLLEMANTRDYVETYNEAVANDNAMVTSDILKRTPIPFDPDTLSDISYLEEIFHTAVTHSHQVSISGGTEETNYSVGFDYLNQDGIIDATDYTRYKVRAAVTTQVKKRLKTGINLNIINSKRNLITSSGHYYGAVRYAIFRTSAIPIKYDNGEWVDLWEHYRYFGDGYNPVAMLDKYDNTENLSRALGNLFVEYSIMPELKFKTEVGLDATFGRHKQFTETWGTSDRIGYPGSVDLADWQGTMLNWVNTLNYMKSFGEHNLNLLLGSEVLKNTTTTHSSSDSRYEDQEDIFRYLGVGLNEIKGVGESYSAWSLLSTFARAEYNFSSKYLLSANVRRDGSSRFSEENRFGTFFSGSAGWRIDREDFFDGIKDKISMLKIRVSAGQLGNQEIGVYPTASTYGSGYNYVFGSSYAQSLALGYAVVDRGNEDIRWETTTQYDAGIDAGFFANKLTFTADFFVKITDDMLVAAPVSAIGGSANPPYVNAGKVRNQGVELDLKYRSNRGDFYYGIESNIAFLQNEVLSLGTGQPILGGEIDNGIYASRTAPGQPIGAFYMLEMDGIFQNAGEVFSSPYQGANVGPGDVKYVNYYDEDFVIDEKDRKYVGSPIPKFTYGLNVDLNYKNFDFTMFFQGVYGNKIYMQIGKDIEGFYRNLNITQRYVDEHWQEDRPSNTMPRASWYAATNNTRPSTRFLFDGSYLRLKNTQLGYTLPKAVAQRMKISSARIYLAGQNLFTLSKYIGMEPEITNSANEPGEKDLAAGIDWGTYPAAITYMLGLNLTF